MRAPLEDALSAELGRLDRALAYAWIALGTLGAFGAFVVRASIEKSIGTLLGAISIGIALVFALVAWRVRRSPLGLLGSILVSSLEGIMPWAILCALSFTQGAAYALASWVPPLVFAASIVAGTARLRPWTAFMIGVSGALAYLASYFLLIRHQLPIGPARLLLYEPPMQITRALSLLFGGAVGAFVARELRRAIARADAKVRTNELVGKYKLVREIAQGGVGAVHEAIYAQEGGFQRRVAVKMLHAHLAKDPAFVTSFRAEAELGARLAHPNIVTILDVAEHEGAYFIAMEYVDGLSLSRLLKNAAEKKMKLDPAIVGHVIGEILAGLEYAHDGVRGADGKPLRILHRDMCPQNVLVSRFGEVKIADFGIARVLGDAAHTHTKTIAGHGAYMAPEQAMGERIDLRTDLFAVGIVVWEMLALKRLFARTNPVATFHAVIQEPVRSILELREDIDPAWNDFLVRALAREPEQRFASAREMHAALAAIPGARRDDAMDALAKLAS